MKTQDLLATVARRTLGAGLGLALAWQTTLAPLEAAAQTAQTAKPAPAAAPAAQPVAANPAMWVIRDADSTIYLFGTFHALRSATQWRTPKIEAAMRDSSEVWLELADVGAPEAEAAMGPLIQRLGLDPARPLSSKLTAAENALLAQAAAKVGLASAQLEPMRPWLAGLQLALMPMLKAGYDPKLGVDGLVAAAAREAGKPVKGFETTEQQLRFFADLPPEAEKQMLLASLGEIEEGPALLDRLSTAWSQGDMRTLETEMVDDMRRETPLFYKVLLSDRNTAWAKAIRERLNGSGTSFIAVGAAHLVGPDSVQAELAELGVRAERR